MRDDSHLVAGRPAGHVDWCESVIWIERLPESGALKSGHEFRGFNLFQCAGQHFHDRLAAVSLNVVEHHRYHLANHAGVQAELVK